MTIKKIFNRVILFAFSSIFAQSIEIPETIYFAGLQLNLTNDLRYELQKQVLALAKNKNYFSNKLKLTDTYFPFIESALEQENIPTDFKYLIIQESGMQSDAVSGSNAVGYWQFKKETAQEVGLTVNADIDERKHIIASTHGAAKYLKKNYQFTINWLYALIAYNTGLGGVKQFLKPEHSGAAEMNLSTDTHWYAIKFLAHKIAYEDKVGYNPSPDITLLPYETDTKGKTLTEIAAQTGVNVDALKNFNKWLTNARVPDDKNYTVLLPTTFIERDQIASQLGIVLDKKTVVNVDSKTPQQMPSSNTTPLMMPKTSTQDVPLLITYNELEAIQARLGDTPAKLAFAGGISPEKFFKYNDMLKFEEVRGGKIYYLESKNNKAVILQHTVQIGETMWDISQKYGIKLKHLYKKNRMEENEGLQEGRVLYLKNKRPPEEPIIFNFPKKEIQKTDPQPISVPKKDTSLLQVPQNQALNKDKVTLQTTLTTTSAPAATEPENTENKPSITQTVKIEPPVIAKKDSVQTIVNTNLPSKSFLKLNTNKDIIKDSSKIYHVVCMQQTLFSIAKHYATKADSIKIWNNIGMEGLQYDQKITTSKKTTALKSKYKTYIVKQTCTIEDASAELSKSIEDLYIWNDKKNGFLLQGELLRIKY